MSSCGGGCGGAYRSCGSVPASPRAPLVATRYTGTPVALTGAEFDADAAVAVLQVSLYLCRCATVMVTFTGSGIANTEEFENVLFYLSYANRNAPATPIPVVNAAGGTLVSFDDTYNAAIAVSGAVPIVLPGQYDFTLFAVRQPGAEVDGQTVNVQGTLTAVAV